MLNLCLIITEFIIIPFRILFYEILVIYHVINISLYVPEYLCGFSISNLGKWMNLEVPFLIK